MQEGQFTNAGGFFVFAEKLSVEGGDKEDDDGNGGKVVLSSFNGSLVWVGTGRWLELL